MSKKKKYSKVANLFFPRTVQLYFLDSCIKMINEAETIGELDEIEKGLSATALHSVSAVVPSILLDIERPRCLDYCKVQVSHILELIENKRKTMA